MKKEFIEPEIEIIDIKDDDIVTDSGSDRFGEGWLFGGGIDIYKN